MTAVLSLRKNDKYTPASQLGDLQEYVNRTFITQRNRVITAVKLREVRNSKVLLGYMGDRVDQFTITIAQFKKFYELSPN